jgi:hypothetical protein
MAAPMAGRQPSMLNFHRPRTTEAADIWDLSRHTAGQPAFMAGWIWIWDLFIVRNLLPPT